ncbi:MAG TPA: transglycosylase domain-containing protein [Acidimicrobiales bacterium]|nr:transglycosylase domain-containing protein [Acidimicrobiales bacterium]
MRQSSQGLLEPLPPAAATRPPARGPARRRSFLWRYRRVWFLLGVLTFTALAGAAWVLTQIPLPPEAPQAQTTVIYDGTGGQLATLHGVENRFPVSIDKIPPVLTAAVVAAEDRKFFLHGGIDPLGIARATWADIRRKGVTQGGSTITQQYVKNAYVGNDYTLWRKIREAVISVKIERKYDKHEILERYLNTVYFGRGAYGVQAAAKAYFDKDISELGLKESAYLAGLIRSPSAGDVAEDPVEAHDLRFIVLQAMVDTKVITPEEANAAEAVPVGDYVVAPPPPGSTVTITQAGAEYFVEYVRRELVKMYPEDQVLRGGMRVYTTLDPTAQRQAYDAVYGLLDRNSDPAGALVSLDTEGRVVAMVGGKDWGVSKVNLAVGTDGGGSGRQAGSTFKPFVLAEAMAQGISLEQTFRGPAQIILPKADKGTDWEVNNYDGAHYGPISLLRATAESVNTVYAQLVTTVGPEKVVEMARRLGIKSELTPHASIALGTADVSVLEMAGAYLTLQSKGMQIEPRVIRRITQNDSVLVDDKPRATRVLDRAVAEKVSYALQQVVDEGSGTAAALPQAQVWGKTGTTDLYGDAWFVGYTRQFTTAVWMGYPEGQAKPLHNVHGVSRVNGGSLPAQIFKRYMSKANPADDTPPDKVPDLTGRTVAPVAAVASSGSSSSSGSRSTTTVAEEEEEEDEEESPTTTARPATATTVPEPVTVPSTAPSAVTTPTTSATNAPRPRPTVTFTIPDRP